MLRFVYSFVVKIFNYVNHVRHCIRKYTSCACCTGQGNDFELIPMVRMESQHSVGVPTCHDFPRFVFRSQKSLTMFKPDMRFSEKRPLTGKFLKMFSKRIHANIDPHLVCKFREIWRPDKKIWARSPTLTSARIAPKICQGQLQTIFSECPKFHPNPFTSGGVIAGRVNVIETRHKEFPILGEASSPSKKFCLYQEDVWSKRSN